MAKATVADAFNVAFNAAEPIEFREEWRSGDYLQGAVEGEFAPKLEPSEVVSFIDHNHASGPVMGRKGVIIGTRLGNVVVFQRRAGQSVFVTNQTIALRQTGLIENGPVNIYAMFFIVGSWGEKSTNIGATIENTRNQLVKEL